MQKSTQMRQPTLQAAAISYILSKGVNRIDKSHACPLLTINTHEVNVGMNLNAKVIYIHQDPAMLM